MHWGDCRTSDSGGKGVVTCGLTGAPASPAVHSGAEVPFRTDRLNTRVGLHTHVHTRAHTNTRARTHTCACAHTWTHMHMLTHGHMHMFIHAHMCTCSYMCRDTHMLIRVCTCTHMCTCSRIHMLMHVRTQTHMLTCSRTCRNTHMHMLTHVHMHTCTRTAVALWNPPLSWDCSRRGSSSSSWGRQASTSPSNHLQQALLSGGVPCTPHPCCPAKRPPCPTGSRQPHPREGNRGGLWTETPGPTEARGQLHRRGPPAKVCTCRHPDSGHTETPGQPAHGDTWTAST